MPKKVAAKVAEIEKYTDDLMRVRFDLPEPMEFEAGQFMSIAVEGFIRRSYSIGNSPANNSYMETYVDCSPGGPGSKYFLNLKEGDTADILAPLGKFVYRQGRDPVYFFATGTGIVPFISMIEHELYEVASNRPIILFYGVRHEERTMIEDRLYDLDFKNDNFSYHLYVSRPKGEWQGRVGRFSEAIPELDLSGADIYICGGTGMIEEVEELALKQGAEPENIHYEKFY